MGTMKVSKGTTKAIEVALGELREAGSELTRAQEAAIEKITAAWATFGDAVNLALGSVNDAREPYNEKLEALRTVIEDATTELRERHDARSDAWRESDAGTQNEAAIEELSSVIDDYTEVEPPTFDAGVTIEHDGVPDLDAENIVALNTEIVNADTDLDLGGAL